MRRIRGIGQVIDIEAKTVERKFYWEKIARGDEEWRQVRVQRPTDSRREETRTFAVSKE